MFFGAAVYTQRIFWIHEHGKVSVIFVFMNLFSGPPHRTHSSIKGVRDRSLQQTRYSMHLFGQQLAPAAPYWFDNFNIMEVYGSTNEEHFARLCRSRPQHGFRTCIWHEAIQFWRTCQAPGYIQALRNFSAVVADSPHIAPTGPNACLIKEVPPM